jgi:hypothetical protein
VKYYGTPIPNESLHYKHDQDFFTGRTLCLIYFNGDKMSMDKTNHLKDLMDRGGF